MQMVTVSYMNPEMKSETNETKMGFMTTTGFVHYDKIKPCVFPFYISVPTRFNTRNILQYSIDS